MMASSATTRITPRSNLTDAVPAEFQELVNGTKKPADVLKGIHEKYDVGVEDMGVKAN